MLCVAWPLDATLAAKLFVTEAGVVAGTAGAALLPRPERRFGIGPRRKRLSVAIPEIHPAGVVEEDVEIRTGLPRRVDRFLRKMHRAVRIRERARFLPPR